MAKPAPATKPGPAPKPHIAANAIPFILTREDLRTLHACRGFSPKNPFLNKDGDLYLPNGWTPDVVNRFANELPSGFAFLFRARWPDGEPVLPITAEQAHKALAPAAKRIAARMPDATKLLRLMKPRKVNAAIAKASEDAMKRAAERKAADELEEREAQFEDAAKKAADELAARAEELEAKAAELAKQQAELEAKAAELAQREKPPENS